MTKLACAFAVIGCCTFGYGQMSHERLVGAGNEPGNWLTYSRTYDAQRFSPLEEVNRSNVLKLRVNWVYQMKDVQVPLEMTPLVVDGIMYAVKPPADVVALDTLTGRPFWTYSHTLADKIGSCCGPVNKGLAILDDHVFFATLDSHLIALDSKTGTLLWDVVVADYRIGATMTVAPIAVKHKVIVGISGGDYGVRGFIDAYNAKSGKREWRFYTIPGPGEPGHDTWSGDSWKTGGADTWVPGSFDPQLNLVYWGTGNPAPDYNGDGRKGDNLYSDCVVAIDIDTGKLKWYFQFTPHDNHDWDATEMPVLVNAEFRGRIRKLMLFGNRNGFYYILDRETGEFLMAKQFATLDALTGEELWRFQTGAPVNAAPISYLSHGKQQIAIAAGSSIFTFAVDGR